MRQLECSTEAGEALRSWRFHPPPPLVPLKLAVGLLRSQGVPNEPRPHLCGLSKAPLSRSLHASQEGGVERLQALPLHRQESALRHPRTPLEAPWRAPPPAPVAAAAAPLAARTGIKRGPTPTRQC